MFRTLSSIPKKTRPYLTLRQTLPIHQVFYSHRPFTFQKRNLNIHAQLKRIFVDDDLRSDAFSKGITTALWNKSFPKFHQYLARLLLAETEESINLINVIRKARKNHLEHELLYKLYLKYVLENFEQDIVDLKYVSEFADLRKPHEWYPQARKMKRKFVFHLGPTNSGKSHHAIERLIQAKRGMYCAPLRLLATEIYVKLTARGIKCNLMIGDDKREVEGATHISCTAEILNTAERVDVAVIDEIQLIGDEDRGWAWTKSLLGVLADEVHLCGEERALNLLKSIVADCGDEYEVRRYERLTPLEIMKHPITSLKKLKKGDCVVVFSRKAVYKLKKDIERETNLKVAVVYGSLPAETRIQQAQLFNESDFDVLVATDAIGYGLNLNIGRIIFWSMEKFDGYEIRPLDFAQIKQIAGRAGRFGSRYPVGYVTTHRSEDLKLLRAAFESEMEEVQAAGLQPTYEQLANFATEFQEEKLSILLNYFYSMTQLDQSKYFMCNYEDKAAIADLIHDIPLSFQERYKFTMVPLNTKDADAMSILRKYALYYHAGKEVPIIVKIPPQIQATKPESFLAVESAHQTLSAYCWLSFHFEEAFVHREEAQRMQLQCRKMLEQSLELFSEVIQYQKGGQEGRRLRRSERKKRIAEKLREQKRKLAAELASFGL